MAKINIIGVTKGTQNYTIHIVLTEQQTIEGQSQDVPIGEAFVPIPHKMEMADIQDRIVDTSKEIMDAHKDAQDKRRDIEELDLPEIK